MIDYLNSKNDTITFQITLDGQKEDHNKVRYVSKTKGSYDKIVANQKLLAINQIPCVVRVNYTAEKLIGCKVISHSFNDLDPLAKQFLTFDFH